jgi:hypothetical protein
MEQFREKYLPIVLLIGIGTVLLLALLNLFRVPKNLKESIEKLNETRSEINASLEILNRQKAMLDSIQFHNEELLKDLKSMKIENLEVTESIEDRFDRVNNYLWTIKRDLDKVPKKKDSTID